MAFAQLSGRLPRSQKDKIVLEIVCFSQNY